MCPEWSIGRAKVEIAAGAADVVEVGAVVGGLKEGEGSKRALLVVGEKQTSGV